MAEPRSIRLPDDLLARILSEAQANERTFNGQVIYLLRRGLEVVDRERKLIEGGSADAGTGGGGRR
jgi:hypothetical protein